MKISKSLIQAVTVATTVSACTKEPVSPEGTEVNKKNIDPCLGCGMG